MKQILLKLSHWLKISNNPEESEKIQELSEYAEPWHEEAVKEYGGEPISEEEYARENFQTSLPKNYKIMDRIGNKFRVYQDVLKNEGFLTPYFGRQDSLFLGKGAFGAVFRIVYQGKPAAVKIILDNYDPDAKHWEKISQLKKQMPPELAKHIPEVYQTGYGTIDENGEEVNYQFVVMEELKPLTAHMYEQIQGSMVGGDPNQPLQYSPQLDKIFQDEEYLYKLSEKLYFALPNKIKKSVEPIDIFNIILNYQPHKEPGFRQVDLAKKILHGLSRKAEVLNPGNIGYETVANRLEEVLERYVSPRFPEEFGYFKDGGQDFWGEEYWANLPETKTFFEALKYLKDSGLGFSDLQRSNVMMDQEGNLKIIDVGLYEEI